MENLVRILRQMEQNKFSTNKMRRDECKTLDSIREPLSWKDCSNLFPTDATTYFIKKHRKSKKLPDFLVFQVKMRKEEYLWRYSTFYEKGPLERGPLMIPFGTPPEKLFFFHTNKKRPRCVLFHHNNYSFSVGCRVVITFWCTHR